ncbi:ubiquitin-associated protein 1 isoform X2 [Scleropages formosus]|uniref:ubiquitin-associated protein 1 isoform X2 n=1 Tax=Scleropages formosus TaxID=113540 RepID=UPI0008783F3C|nr:ubiquitin-associated protein 1 isoform X2 [Scleropages formosus]
MAARRPGSDIHNTGPISYLDDVPFKLNDKFRCPAKVGLPIGFCLPECNPVLSEAQYDFSLERRSVQWGEELTKARKAQQKAQLQADIVCTNTRKSEQTAVLQDQSGGPGDRKPCHPSDEKEPPPPALNPVLAGLMHNAILTPLPAPSLGPVRHPSPPPSQSLNLADFEREEDPFDKLELKTLDDKEELRSILQVQLGTPLQPRVVQCSTEPELAKPGGFHKPNGLVTLLEVDRPGGTPVGQLETDRPCNIRSLTFPKLSDPVDSSESKSYIPSPECSLPNGIPPGFPQVTSQNESCQQHHSRMHSETLKQPDAVPTAASPQSACAEPTDRMAGRCRALLSLSPSERECVETIVGMGYSYEGVLKAMQRQGQNVEQVLDYLFIHSRLCEQGFDASTVEECLEMYQCSEEKALQFLQLMTRFGEMGFERDTIKEVLLVHNNDQDKALEDLMARAAAS